MPCSRGVPAGGCLLLGEKGSAPGGYVCGDHPPPKKQTATVAEGTHPTGMHSCVSCEYLPGFVICARQLDRIVDIHLDFTLSNIKSKKLPGLRKYKEQKLYVRSKITIKIA